MPSRLLPRTTNARVLPWLPRAYAATQTNVTAPTAPMGTSVTAGASANTKNTTYTELITSTNFDTYWVEVAFNEVFSNGTNTATLVDIATGAAASEAVLIPNLNAGFAATQNAASLIMGGQLYCFPVYIPSGTRVSATAQGAVGSQTVRCSIWLYGGGTPPDWTGTTVTAYGANTSTSAGVSVVCGTSSAEGSYTQITAATTSDHQFLGVGVGGAADASLQTSYYNVDLGVGPATETTISENNVFFTNTSEILLQRSPIGVWYSLASGTRLAVRASETSATAQSLDAIVYGVS